MAVEREHVARTSADVIADRLAALAELYPEAFSDGAPDLDLLSSALGVDGAHKAERYSFSWAGKRDAMGILQMPSRATLLPVATESTRWESSANTFIEGDNLEVLKLLYRAYSARVKLIYLDPPYNIGDERIYRDNYSDPLESYLRHTQQVDEAGNLLTSNPETSGRHHSAWLSMLYPRLFYARQLLRDDGLIFLSIDDTELHNLRMLMNELFGEENFVACLPTIMNLNGNYDAFGFVDTHEYTLVYARNKATCAVGQFEIDESEIDTWEEDEYGLWKRADTLRRTGQDASRERRPLGWFPVFVREDGSVYVTDNDEPESSSDETMWPISDDGEELSWTWSKRKITADAHNLFVVNGRKQRNIYKKQRPQLGDLPSKKPKSVFYRPSYSTSTATNDLRNLFGEKVFGNPKPVPLLRDFITIGMAAEDEIVLDFFAGSGTAGHAMLDLNRQDGGTRRFILVQLPEPTGRTDYPTISEIAKERLRRVIQRMDVQDASRLPLEERHESEQGFRVFRLAESNFRPWSGVEGEGAEAYSETMAMFADPLVDDWQPEPVIWEVAIKEGYALTSDIVELSQVTTNKVYRVSDKERVQEFTICLDSEIAPETFPALGLGKDDLFICRDAALTDESAANLALQCRFKTI